jgi:mono/diheme cytochrome c family protein
VTAARAVPVVLALLLLGALPAHAQNDQAAAADGLRLYTTLCQACHMADGAGAGPYPKLRDNPTVRQAGPAYVAQRVLHGYGAMIPFCNLLTVDEVVDIANWLPSHLGNTTAAPPVDPETIRAQWPSPASCP